MTSAIVKAQSQRIGFLVLASPILTGIVVAVIGGVSASVWSRFQAMMLVAGLAQVFVIIVGICVAVVVTGDPLIELHEATLTGFRTVQLSRAGLVALAGLIGAAVMFFPLHMGGLWPSDKGWLSVLSPGGAVVIVTVAALFVAAFAGTSAATTVAVIAMWMFLATLWDPYIAALLVQRGLPLVVSAVLLVVVWYRLGDTERNIAKQVAV